MPAVSAATDRGQDRAAACAAELRIIGVGHHLEVVNRFNIGRVLPAPGQAYRSAIQQKLISTFPAAVDDKSAIGIPAAQTRETRGSELFLSEQHSWYQADQ